MLLFANWTDDKCTDVVTASVDARSDYRPGQLYKRVLSPPLRVLHHADALAITLIIDGYVWLDAKGAPGMGSRLHACTGGSHVIGVAKNPYNDAEFGHRVIQDQCSKPLYVTAIGMNPRDATAKIELMHEPYRIPSMACLADQVARRA